MTQEERRARIAALEVELAQLRQEEAEVALADGAALVDECVGMVRAGRRVEAVKFYRNRMGTGLREAMEAVDGFAARADS